MHKPLKIILYTLIKQYGLLCLFILCPSVSAAADTILIGDFCGVPPGKINDPSFSLGLPYFIAREINGSGDGVALLPTDTPSKTLSALYNDQGMPRPGEARLLCAQYKADRYLLGSFSRPKNAKGDGEKISATFYSGSASGGDMEVFKITADGGDKCIPALAVHVAGKICRLQKDARHLRADPGFLPPFAIALQLVREGKMAEALKKAAKVSSDYPESADARYLGGLAAIGAKKPYLALRMLNEARNLDPSFSMPAYREGMIWLSLERTTLAERAFENASRIQPSFFDAGFQSGRLKAMRGDCASAIKELRRMVALNPKDSDARYWLASCLIKSGKADEGRRILKGLVADDPANGAAHLLLGKSYYEAKNFAAAETELRSAVRLCPNSVEAHKLLADSLSKQGGYNRHAEAVLELQKALLLEGKK